MKVLVIDVEASGANKANPFGRSNKLACVGLFDGVTYTYVDIEHSGLPYNTNLELVSQKIKESELLIGHNIKYDIHWLRRYIPNLIIDSVWDTQLFEYMASNQTWIMPSLNDSLIYHGLPGKSDLIATEYWDKGLSTLDIPQPLLKEYNEGDCQGTYLLYQCQIALQRENTKALFQLHCDDLLVLEEMEHNGLIFSEEE